MRTTLLAVLFGVLTAACSTGGGEGLTASPSSPATQAATSPSTSPSTSTEPTPASSSQRSGCIGRPDNSPAEFDAEGGVYAVFLTDFRPGELTAEFDVIQWLSGERARQAYEEDTGDTEGPPNDYYIRNDSHRLRTAPVSPGASYWIVQLSTDSDADVDRTDAIGFAEDRAEGYPEDVFWLTLNDGAISEICQQYRP